MDVVATPWTSLRKVLTAALLALGCVLTVAAMLAGLLNREVLDPGRFSRSVDAIRSDPAVSAQLGEAITDRVLQFDRDLVAVKPLIEVAATTLVRSSAFTPIVLGLARQMHTAFTVPGSDQIALRLSDVGAVLVPILRSEAPNLAAQLPADFDVTLARIGAQDFAADSIRAADTVGTLSWLLPLLAVVSFALAVLLGIDRRRQVSRVGAAVATAALITWLLVLLGDAIVARQPQDTLHGAIIHAAWHRLTAVADRAAIMVALGGLALACVSQTWVATVTGRLAALRPVLTRRPRTEAGWALRTLVVGGVGLALVFWPPMLRLVGTVAGLALVLVALHQWSSRPEAERRATTQTDGRRVPRRGATVAAIALLGVLVLAASSLMAVRPTVGDDPPPEAAAAAELACDGWVQLCDRPYDQVAFAATHNAMAAADEPGWLFAEQPDGLVDQLDHGVRVLLIDTWLGQPTNRSGIVTTVAADYKRALAGSNEEIGTEVTASTLRVQHLLGLTPTGDPAPYLCHNLCEFGATRWEPAMAQVAAWMAAHPREVVTLFVQDEGVSPSQTAEVFRQSGLLPYVATQAVGRPWPTLGQMIDSGHRLVVLMENQDGGTTYPWQLPGFSLVQDTPFHFTSAAQFSCDRLRGSADSPLLLVNHWLSNQLSRVSDSAKINAQDVLGPRVMQCQQERHHLPNFVAVNYYDEGDLFQVVDQLNGLP